MHLFLQVRIFNASTTREVESSKTVGARIKSMNLSGRRGEYYSSIHSKNSLIQRKYKNYTQLSNIK